jgi:ketosteroid isomerase-like protein
MKKTIAVLGAVMLSTSGNAAMPSREESMRAVADIDTRYQAAVKANDAATMDKILAPDFTLVTGDGSVFSKKHLLDSARNKDTLYEHQEEEPGTQTVRVWGYVAVVTAKLWLKGTRDGKPFERKLWFSDTYRFTPAGWRYIFGQASLPLPMDKSLPLPRDKKSAH